MADLYNILIGIFVVIAATGILALFKLRQLYYVVPKSFAYNELTTAGATVLIELHNRARFHEDNVVIELDPKLKYDVVAATSVGIELSKNELRIPRIPKRSATSVILLTEPADFTPSSISIITSNETTAIAKKSIEDVPPNFGYLFLGLAITLGVMALTVKPLISDLIDSQEKISELQHQSQTLSEDKDLSQFSTFIEEGWDVKWYAGSDFQKAYSTTELPLAITSYDFEDRLLSVDMVFTNKTASIVKFVGSFTDPTYDEGQVSELWRRKTSEKSVESLKGTDYSKVNSYDLAEVDPGESFAFKLSNYVPIEHRENAELFFQFHYLGDLHVLKFNPKKFLDFAEKVSVTAKE